MLADMAAVGCGGLGSSGSQGRVQGSLPFQPSALCSASTPPKLLPQFHQGESPSFRDRSLDGEGSRRTGSSNSRVLQPGLCDYESFGGVEAHYRPFGPEPDGGVHQVPHGDTTFGSQVDQDRGLGSVHRSQGRIPAGSSTSGIQAVLEVCGAGPGPSVSGPSFRPDHVSAGFYEGDGSNLSHHASSGVPNVEVPRRLVDPGQLPGSGHPGQGFPFKFVFLSRYKDQPREVEPCTNADSFVPRDEHSDFSFEGFSDRGEDSEVPPSVGGILLISPPAGHTLEEPPRENVLSINAYPGVKTQNSIPSTLPEKKLGLPGRQSDDPVRRFLFGGSSVVVRSLQSDPRGTTGVPHTGLPSVHGCLGSGLGRHLGPPSGIRPLVSLSAGTFHQSQGASGSPSSHRVLPRQHLPADCGVVLRQCHSSGVSAQFRGDKVSDTQCSRSTDSPLLRGESDHHPPTVHPGSDERDSRCIEPITSGSGGRVVSQSPSVRGGSETLALQCGPFRHGSQQQAPSLLFPSPRPSLYRDGRYAPRMGTPGGVRVSPLCHGPTGLGETASVQRYYHDSDSSLLAPTPLVPGASGAASGGSGEAARQSRSAQTTALPSRSPEPPRASADGMATLQRAARAQGFSKAVAQQLAHCRRRSTRVMYQARWATYRTWCRTEGHSISRPSIPKVADFLLYLRRKKGLSVSAISGYRSMLSAVFRFHLPEISSHQVLRDLIRSFSLERPAAVSRVPPWDLSLVLDFLRSEAFEPLAQLSLRELTKKTIFLLSLATARRVGELQAIHKVVSFQGEDAHLSFLPEFRAKTESEANPLPRSFVVRSLKDFVGDLEDELLLCPVRALRCYLQRTERLQPHPRSLFVSPRSSWRPLSKNAVSFFLREVITQAYASGSTPGPSTRPRAHSIRGMATSTAFLRNHPVRKVLEAACWRSPSVFTSFYLKDVQFSSQEGFGLGPFVAAGSVVT